MMHLSTRIAKRAFAPSRRGATLAAHMQKAIAHSRLLLLSAILMVSPFLQGLFFSRQTLYFTFLIGVLAALTLAVRPGFKITPDPVCLSLLALALWYMAGVVWAVNKEEAVLGGFRMAGYAVLYCVASMTLTRKIIGIGAWMLALVAATLVLAGISSGVGLPAMRGGWEDKGGSFVLSSCFQYHNAFAGYLLLCIPVTLWLYSAAATRLARTAAVGALYFEILGLVGSSSRGAWLVFALVVLILPAIFRLRAPRLLAFLALVLWAAVDDWTRVALARNAHHWSLPLWPFAGLVVTLFLDRVWPGLSKEIPSPRRQVPALLGVILILIIGTYPLTHHRGQFGVSAVAAINTMGFHDSNWQVRLVFYRDAFNAGLTSPWLGLGAGSWTSSFCLYQSFAYISRDLHSETMTILVEAGVIGLFVYGGFWVLVLGRCYRGLKRTGNEPDILLGLGAIAVFIHSQIDFDLSFGAVWFAMLLVLAAGQVLLDGERHAPAEPGAVMSRLAAVSLGTLTALLLLGSPFLLAGAFYADAGAQEFKAGREDAAAKLYFKARKCDPFRANVYGDLAQLEAHTAAQNHDGALAAQAVQDIEIAIRLNQNEPEIRVVAARVYLLAGYPERAFLQALETRRLASLYSASYEEVGQYGIAYASESLLKDHFAEAKGALAEVLALPQRIAARLNAVPPDAAKLASMKSPLAVTRKLLLDIGQAQALSGQKEAALLSLEFLGRDPALGRDAMLWKRALEGGMDDNMRVFVADLPPAAAEKFHQIQTLLRKSDILRREPPPPGH